jgi:hypothetical protein
LERGPNIDNFGVILLWCSAVVPTGDVVMTFEMQGQLSLNIGPPAAILALNNTARVRTYLK